ncbi:hypothetical protein MXD58_029065, partial [Frankia sp. AgKG'84/4]|nr:hypothetical protein [Frankia sp. AgKG'84/4]
VSRFFGSGAARVHALDDVSLKVRSGIRAARRGTRGGVGEHDGDDTAGAPDAAGDAGIAVDQHRPHLPEIRPAAATTPAHRIPFVTER